MTTGRAHEATAGSTAICADSKPVWFDPHNQIAGAARIFADNIVPGLMRIGDDVAPEASLAASWRWESDRRLVLSLVRDREFTSGRPVDARAVSRNLLRVMRKPNVAFNGDEFARIAECEVSGESELVLTLREPFAPLPAVLANGFGIVDPDCGEPPMNLVGAGRYQLASMSRHAYQLVSSTDPALSVSWLFCLSASARARRIRAGAADILFGSPGSDTARAHGWEAHTSAGNGPIHLAFNLRKWPTSALGFRSAVAASLDRAAVIQRGFGGLAAAGDAPYPTHSAFDLRADNQRRATRKAVGAYPELELAVGGDLYVATARAAADVVEEATGAHVSVVSVPNPEWWPGYYMSGKWDLAVQAWTPMPDPHFVYGRRYASWGMHNGCGYSNSRVDSAVRLAEREVNPDRRLMHFRDAEAERAADLPTIYIGFPNRVWAAKPGTRALQVRTSWNVELA